MAFRYTNENKRVTGGGALAQALANMAEDARLGVIVAGVTAAVKPIRTAMVAYCPIRIDLEIGYSGKKLRPGEMQASIRDKVVAYPRDAKAVGLIGPTGRAKRVAHLVENGHIVAKAVKGKTIRRGTARATTHGMKFVPGKHFIKRSMLTTLDEQATRFTQAAADVYLNSVENAS